MKMLYLRPVAILLLSAVIFAGCKKESKKSNLEYLTQALWKFDNAGFDNDKNGTIDVVDQDIQDCQKDDIIDFNSDGTGSHDEGVTKCDPNHDQITAFAWLFKVNETQIEYDGKLFTILSLNDNQLKIYYDIDLGGGNTTRYLLISKH